MGFTTDLLIGVAQLLDAENIGAYKPEGKYADDEVGIVLGVPAQKPPKLIALAVYNNVDDPALSDSTVMLQARYRSPSADPRLADDLADAVFASLQGRHGAILGEGAASVRLVYARRRSTLPLGIDGNGRHERADNYELTVHRPSTHRE